MNEDILDGSCCTLCCSYFEDPAKDEDGEHAIFVHGAPVVCWECWDDLNEKEKKLYKKAKVKSM